MPAETDQRDPRPPVVVITGPTASGKTELAIALAERFDGEIVNADSMQVFRHMDIGTAKPTAEERRRVPHHLFDVANPDEHYSAGRYAQEARAAAAAIHARGHVVFLTGGTGLYIRAFLDGLVETGRADPHIRERLEREQSRAEGEGDPTRLHRRLAEFDPEAADKIHPNDVRRVVRALEILEQSGQRASSVRDAHGFRDRPFRVLHLCIDPGREALHERIARRSKAMIDGGLLREVRQLRELGYGPELRPMQAIGYRHIQPVVDGADTLVNALAALETDTRRFARRQRTWIRAVPDVEWFDPADADAIFARVERFLAGDETGAREQGVQTATAEAERGPSRRDARGTRSRAAESAG
ncbi:MAG: tRNA (adenosine(37)-N6)-dimethylallyltransferase MiaA [Spirochaetaceae bacterium]|nr:tRNA (adenosine(37)-N6)-dimethylallyltransferase MiaA [Myxococcales bacterium]MCB9725262.1 tRNA (adenosine(37)-N6)-dimethylallyltransferase MiaA [Spirochaetaceae bacterium]